MDGTSGCPGVMYDGMSGTSSTDGTSGGSGGRGAPLGHGRHLLNL